MYEGDIIHQDKEQFGLVDVTLPWTLLLEQETCFPD